MSYTIKSEIFAQLVDMLEKNCGIDLSKYRDKCIMRRIAVRLRALHLEKIENYIDFLNQNPNEYDKLLDVLTINVTQFFRNPSTFDAIRTMVIPKILARKQESGQRHIRFWSAGCASGEETFSLAILLKEALQEETRNYSIIIYGTDVDQGVIRKAKEGAYSWLQLEGIPKAYLEKHFFQIKDKFALDPEIKKMVYFKKSDLLKDEGFTRIDLILCRNILIYFSLDIQEQILAKFHRSLNADGFLILGKVESLIGSTRNSYFPINLSERIFLKKA